MPDLRKAQETGAGGSKAYALLTKDSARCLMKKLNVRQSIANSLQIDLKSCR
ncbi:hypothetical protein SAMN05518849_11842 [Sphingobium sp. AP50]|nr:hypothetical protein SAMN05518849_11842 [Sphingobium sp. AP50]